MKNNLPILALTMGDPAGVGSVDESSCSFGELSTMCGRAAFGVAGTGRADETSEVDAILYATKLAKGA